MGGEAGPRGVRRGCVAIVGEYILGPRPGRRGAPRRARREGERAWLPRRTATRSAGSRAGSGIGRRRLAGGCAWRSAGRARRRPRRSARNEPSSRESVTSTADSIRPSSSQPATARSSVSFSTANAPPAGSATFAVTPRRAVSRCCGRSGGRTRPAARGGRRTGARHGIGATHTGGEGGDAGAQHVHPGVVLGHHRPQGHGVQAHVAVVLGRAVSSSIRAHIRRTARSLAIVTTGRRWATAGTRPARRRRRPWRPRRQGRAGRRTQRERVRLLHVGGTEIVHRGASTTSARHPSLSASSDASAVTSPASNPRPGLPRGPPRGSSPPPAPGPRRARRTGCAASGSEGASSTTAATSRRTPFRTAGRSATSMPEAPTWTRSEVAPFSRSVSAAEFEAGASGSAARRTSQPSPRAGGQTGQGVYHRAGVPSAVTSMPSSVAP